MNGLEVILYKTEQVLDRYKCTIFQAVISVSYRVYEIMVAIVAFIWFIIGTIWVYEVFAIVSPHTDYK